MFNVGDLAQLVNDSPANSGSYNVLPGTPLPLKKGYVGRVVEAKHDRGKQWIAFVVGDDWFSANRFRKIKASDTKFAQSMRALRPTKVPA